MLVSGSNQYWTRQHSFLYPLRYIPKNFSISDGISLLIEHKALSICIGLFIIDTTCNCLCGCHWASSFWDVR